MVRSARDVRPLTRRSFLLAGAAASAGLLFSGSKPRAAGTTQPLVETTCGKVRGALLQGIATFKGIPYGASTAGANRFMPPQKRQPWSGVRDASSLGQYSPQIPGDFTKPDLQVYYPIPNPPETMGEDCLVLNVWTRAIGRAHRRPVMVWLHGGGFASSSDGPYDLLQLAKFGDVVTVGINHRLNMFGYLYLAEIGGEKYADSGNAGMLDIVAALGWVRDNIAAFGGDPANVTIFGQSGGGAKVSTLMAMPAARGLFHRAIVESGSGLRAIPADVAGKNAETLLGPLGITKNRIDELQRLPMEQLLAAMKSSGPRLAPVVDGRSLPRHPFDPDAPAISADVPMLIGSNRTETTVLIGEYQTPDVDVFALDDATMRIQLKKYARLSDADADRLIALYRAAHPGASPSDIFFLITSDRGTRMNAIRQAERKAAQGKAPAYMYLLTWETPILGGKLRSPHNLEIPFVFHDVDNKIDANTGDGKERYALQDQMAGAWVAFARGGNPNHAGLPRWPVYDASTRATMIFDAESKVVNDPDHEERLALGSLPVA